MLPLRTRRLKKQKLKLVIELDSILVFIVLYAILLFADLIPLIKNKDKKALYLSIPVYLITLTANFLVSLNLINLNLSQIITRIISSIIKIE